MENAVYNELCMRGYSVDVGVVEINERQADGKYVRKQIEIDFVTKDNVVRHHDENGVLIMGLQEFLMDERSVEE